MSNEILRFQFEGAAEKARKRAGNDDVAACFDGLAATVHAVPEPLLNAYLEFFEDCGDSERDGELMDEIRFRLWSPASATEYLQRYVTVASGLD
ncbi:hypothetical protein V5279_23935 [Bradyrhizobium sp. 26S5]|uniref:hypothetical protein n=1 Tax=Bradyrhizobium sp. 26S5 TaxID=3139729 RepID=UPI0030D0B45D